MIACEVLAIGDARILWLPDRIGELPPSSKTPKKKPAKPRPRARRLATGWRFATARAGDGWAAAGDPAAADAVRVFSRQALYDKP